MASLFDVQVPAINKHLSNIYDDGELDKKATISILEIVQNEGGRKIARKVDYYNLDAIISVGYRVNSAKITQKIVSDFDMEVKKLLENPQIKKSRSRHAV